MAAQASDPLRTLLEGEQVPALSTLLATFSATAVAAACTALPAGLRVRAAAAWYPWSGLKPDTAAAADAAIARILAAETPMSPFRSPKQKRRRDSRPKQTDSDTAAEFDEQGGSRSKLSRGHDTGARDCPLSRFLNNLQTDADYPMYCGMESATALRLELESTNVLLLRKLAARLGVPSDGSKNGLCMDILLQTIRDATDTVGGARPDGVAAAGAAGGSARRRPSARTPALPVDTGSSEDTQESSSDSSDWESPPPKPTNHRKVAAFSSAALAPLVLREAVISIHGGGSAQGPEAQRTLAILREAAQDDSIRGAVDRLLKAARNHLARKDFPRKLTHEAGKYYGPHRPVALVGSAGEWVKDCLSYRHQGDATVLADNAVLDWVGDLGIDDEGRLVIPLDSQLTADMLRTSGVYGWAEAVSAAAGVAARQLWAPLLEWTSEAMELEAEPHRVLWGKLELILARAVGTICICDAQGLQRLLAKALVMVLAVSALQKARDIYDTAVWKQLLGKWLSDLQHKALLHMFFASTHRNTALLTSARVEASPLRAAQNRPHGASGDKHRSAPRDREKRDAGVFDDDPDKFVWCGLCRTHRHCLWACPSAARELQRRVEKGASAQAAAASLAANTRGKYKQKGKQFLDALDKRPGRTADGLLISLAA